MNGWPVTPSFDLPNNYSLREDEDFLYLYYGNEEIASFIHCIEIEILQNIIEAHRNTL